MNFAHPTILWLLLVFPPALVVFFWWAARRRQQLVTQFIEARLLPKLVVGVSPQRQMFRAGCVIVAVVALVIALARPQWGFDLEQVRYRGLDIVVAIDTSKSMLAEDIAPNRLTRAKLAALDLMQQARADRLGLVAFAGDAFLQCPLTFDDGAFRQSVEALDVNIIPQGGTAIAEAINTALTAFKEGDNYKTLVLFTDGEDQDSGALEAAKKASDAGMHIFTVGIGTAEGELLRVRDGKGRTDYIRDAQDNVVKSHLNEELLRQIAAAAQGFYVPLRGAKAIDTLYEKGLAPLPKTEGEEKLLKTYHERYQWPLGVAILLLIIEMLVPERKRESRRERKSAGANGRRLAAQTAVLAMLLGWAVAAPASPSSALKEYREGRYDRALEEYKELLKRKADDPRLHFNAGAAAYRQKQFEQAANQFNEALNSTDLNLQELAYYNRGNSYYHLGEANPDPQKRNESWEKALKDYESSMKLNPQDSDAKFNHDFVKKKLEELKQQQQQQQKSDQNKDQNKDQKQDQNQQSNQQQQDQKDQKDQKDQSQQQQQQDSQKQAGDQNKQDQQKQDSSQQQQRAQNQDQKQQKEEAEKQAKQDQAAQQKDDDQKKQQAGQASAKQNGEEKEEQSQPTAPGEMTPEQAQQLLDNQKNGEKMLPPKPSGKAPDRAKPLKDW